MPWCWKRNAKTESTSSSGAKAEISIESIAATCRTSSQHILLLPASVSKSCEVPDGKRTDHYNLQWEQEAIRIPQNHTITTQQRYLCESQDGSETHEAAGLSLSGSRKKKVQLLQGWSLRSCAKLAGTAFQDKPAKSKMGHRCYWIQSERPKTLSVSNSRSVQWRSCQLQPEPPSKFQTDHGYAGGRFSEAAK